MTAQCVGGPFDGERHEMIGRYLVGPTAVFAGLNRRSWISQPVGLYRLENRASEPIWVWYDSSVASP